MDGSNRVGRDHPNRARHALAALLLAIAACGDDGGSGVDATPPPGDAAVATDASLAGDACACTTSDPGEPGPQATTTASVDLALPGATIPLTIYAPVGPGRFPAVVFHHGFQLAPAQYASYGTHLASWGYVVVMPQMPGGLIGGPTHRDLAGHVVGILDWLDAQATATSGPLAGRVDAAHVALAGHSMGGKIAMLTAASDPRPRAVFGIDPVDAVGSPLPVSATDYPSVTPELMGAITVPIAMLGELTNATCSGPLCQACAPAADNFHQYYEHATHAAIEIEVVGASHMSFLDDPACGFTCSSCPAGTDDPAASRRLTRRYLTAFLNVTLRGLPAYRSYLVGADMAGDVAAGRVREADKNGL